MNEKTATIQYNADRLSANQKVEIMERFTNAYQNDSTDIALREAMCLKEQFPAALCQIEEGDLFAGRFLHLPLGFSPQDEYGFAYYYSEEECNLLLNDKSLTDFNKEKLKTIMDFWREENTQYKVRSAYDPIMAKYLPHDDFVSHSGIAFPLYRMGGSQLDLDKLVQCGIQGLMKEINDKNKENQPLFTAMISALNTVLDVCKYYRAQAIALADQTRSPSAKQEFLQIASTLEALIHHKPETLREAIQLVHLYLILSGSKNYGRMDVYLGDFYVNDLRTKELSKEEALRLLEGFWKLIVVRKNIYDSRVIIGGKGRRNEENADQFALLAMQASENVKEIVPQLTLRCYQGMNQEVFEKAIAVIGEGTTYPMLYNDSVNIPSLAKAFQVSEHEAADYVPFGCGEFILYHRSFGSPNGAINLLQALNVTMRNGTDPSSDTEQGLALGRFEDFHSFEEFYDAYCRQISFFVELLAKQEDLEYKIAAENASFLFLSILYNDCITREKAIFSGGVQYLGGTLETYGNINASDSLTAIKHLVFDQKVISKQDLMRALDADFVGFEALREKLLSAPKYGNDDEAADNMAVQLHQFVCNRIKEQSKNTDLHSYLAVIINNSTNTTFGLNTGASADGRKANTFMANANNPMGGMDKNGITAMLNSLVKPDTDIHAGSTQNLKFSKSMFRQLLPKTKILLKTYFDNGGSQAMINVLNRNDLENALIEPEKYSNLIVRVGGFSAKFIELNREIQQEIISRTLYE